MDRPEDSKGRDFLSSMPPELQLGIVSYLPNTSLSAVCQLNTYWHSVGTYELLGRLLPIPPFETDENGTNLSRDLLGLAIRHHIDTNNADALQRLLAFRPEHAYFCPPTASLLPAEPASLRAQVTTDEEERFCLGSSWTFCSFAVKAAFKYHDMTCMQQLIDHRLVDYGWLLDHAVNDSYHPGEKFARPIPGMDSRDGHNSVLDWLLAYPPRHVAQAMLIMWGWLSVHPRLLPLCDWCDWTSHECSRCCDNMLIVVAGRGHPASLQTIDELCTMVEILTDKATGGVIPEARQPLSHALRIARGMASMWPGTPPLVVEYLQSVCTWEDNQSGRSCSHCSNSNANNPQPPLTSPLILSPEDPVLHQLIDLKTYDEMMEPENWHELQCVESDHPPLLWLVSTEFLTDEDAARRMSRFKRSLWGLSSPVGCAYSLLNAAGAFRRWRCVEVVLGALYGKWPGNWECSGGPASVFSRAILDAVHGEPGCADGRIIRKLLRTGAKKLEDFKGFGVGDAMLSDSPFRGGWFGWETFQLAFVERRQDRERRESPACREMRDAVLLRLSISEQKALNFLVGKPSQDLYRSCSRRLVKRLAVWREWRQGCGKRR